MSLKIAAATLAATMACACDGLVDKEYRGEPLLTLRGSVASSETPLGADAVPTVLFQDHFHTESPDGTELRKDTYQFLAGEVEGQFPSAFTLTLYDAPAAEFVHPLFPGEAPLALGYVAAASAQHPEWVRSERWITRGESPSAHAKACDDEGRCLMSLEVCGSASSTNWPCGEVLPDNLPWELKGWASYFVLYVAQAVPAGSLTSRYYAEGAPLAAGYHVLSKSPAVASAERQACSQRQTQRLRELIEAFDPNWSTERTKELDWAYDEAGARAALEVPCEGDERYQLVPNGGPIDLLLVNLPLF